MIELLMKYCCSFLLLLLLGISGGFAQDKVECWGRYEISLPAKVKGNPFDIELTATFSGPDTTLTVRGFYDGNDTFKIRFMPVSQGVWSYVTQSEIPVLNKVKGRIECIAPGKGNHGPVKQRINQDFSKQNLLLPPARHHRQKYLGGQTRNHIPYYDVLPISQIPMDTYAIFYHRHCTRPTIH
jgi:hypothetical protein